MLYFYYPAINFHGFSANESCDIQGPIFIYL